MHFRGVLLGHGTSPVLVLLLSQVQLPSTEARFLSLAPMRSFPFIACFGKRGSEGKTPAHAKRNLVPRGTWCGGWVESPGSGARCLISLSQLHGPRQEESPPL